MAGQATISGFYETILRAVVDQGARTQPEEYTNFLQILEGTKHTERFREWVQMGLAAVKPEFEPVQFDDPIQGSLKEYTFTVRAKGFRASYESMEDDKFDIIAATASSLGDSMRESTEIDAATVWNNAFAADASPITTFDNLSIINSAHTRLDGGPVRNNLLTGDVSLAMFESARYYFRNDVTDRGFRNQRKLAKVIYAPDASVEPLINQMLAGIGGLQPFTADTATAHELGALRGQIQQMPYSYLNDVDRTIFLSNDALSRAGGPFYMWRRRPSMTSWDDDAIQAAAYASSMRSTFGCPDHHGICGSTGV
jgi:hypothetical protein